MRGWLAIAFLLSLPASAAAQESAQPEIRAIVAMLEAGRLEEAEGELRRILDRSGSAAAHDLLGITLSRLGRLEEAEREFSRAALLAPELLAPKQHLARVLLQLGRPEDALTELRGAARLGPLERDLALWLAETDLSLGNVSQARARLQSVADRFQSVAALMRLARIEARAGEDERAAATLLEAQQIAPNSEEVLSARAKVALVLQVPVPAIMALEALTRMHPTAAEHSYLLGVARLQIGDMGGAIEALRRSLELEPRRSLALIALGTALSAQKRFDEAKEVVRRSLRLDPDNAEALAVLAEAEEGLGELEAAEEHANQALTRQADQARALATIGRIRMGQQRYEEARDALLRSAASAPGTARTHYQLSLAFARLGDRESSREHLELYRRFRKESDDRLLELRTRAGLGASGMGTS